MDYLRSTALVEMNRLPDLVDSLERLPLRSNTTAPPPRGCPPTGLLRRAPRPVDPHLEAPDRHRNRREERDRPGSRRRSREESSSACFPSLIRSSALWLPTQTTTEWNEAFWREIQQPHWVDWIGTLLSSSLSLRISVPFVVDKNKISMMQVNLQCITERAYKAFVVHLQLAEVKKALPAGASSRPEQPAARA